MGGDLPPRKDAPLRMLDSRRFGWLSSFRHCGPWTAARARLVKDGVAQVAAGESWGPVYDKLGEAGLEFSGGRSYRSGIGGLALAGGLSFVSSCESFICDNVLNFEVVLASGSIVNASAHENPELWVALRGGGNNLGVVTRFDFRTFKQGPLYGGSVYCFGQSFPGQLEALVGELQKPDASEKTHLMISIGFAAIFGPQNMCQNQVYCTQGIDMSPVLQPFTAIQPQIDQMNSLSAYMDTTVKADVATLRAASDIYEPALEPLKLCEGIIASMTLQPYPVSLPRKPAVQGGNVLGLEPAFGPLVTILFLTYWESKNNDHKILSTLREALDNVNLC
ncbi:hypothetical protein F4779DRAFT_624119 [Xylariaceae sp. FL0662B]|nr:hypothetical protein F4779DRAFT_624119 [Xylariaceae sp. FL0662B]